MGAKSRTHWATEEKFKEKLESIFMKKVSVEENKEGRYTVNCPDCNQSLRISWLKNEKIVHCPNPACNLEFKVVLKTNGKV